ncbi:NUDIX domain-containing protein [Acinetobacter indicus]|uniref:NUDIX domain-containing protein n=1 Tax=Acinetobacter indicus TaxID=756892 RepID=UPI0032B53962
MEILKQATYGQNELRIQQREFLFRGFIQVEKVSLSHRLFNQNHYTPVIHRELIQRPEAAGVLLYDEKKHKFALIEQFRIGAMDDQDSPWQLEVIAGVLDGDESPESCIRRETLEESGCEVEELQHLFTFYPSAGACAEIFHLYSAKVNLPEQGGVFGLSEEGENIQLHIFEYEHLPILLANGRLRNAPLIIALQWLQQQIKP